MNDNRAGSVADRAGFFEMEGQAMFHKSNLGRYGNRLLCDRNGFVPQEGDGPWDFEIDHGGKDTHDVDGSLTEYGEWWEDEGFGEWRDEAVRMTAEAEQSLDD